MDGFHPLVAAWFARTFPAPTEPQRLGWPAIAAGKDVLLSAPTGTGKTLAAFLHALDGLLREALAGRLPDETRLVYVSPLRALSNDVEKNLARPLAALRAAAVEAGHAPPEIRVAVRTGDTPASRRAALARRPPHVLVTTPESLYLLITAERGREALRAVDTVIVDEIHALAGNKRGAHLALSLERLEALARRRPRRIGLSATVRPLEEVARFLVGTERVGPGGRPRCAIVECGRRRALDLAVEVPRDALASIASKELWAETWDRVAALVRAHRSTLVFVNTRRLAERTAHALAARLGEAAVAAHHGSLARERRLAVEARLKAGALRAVVATASLELGIDVGDVDLAVQLGSPGALATGLQRIGRAAHVAGGVPKGRLFPTTRDELVECAAVVRGLRAGRLEALEVPPAPLDVLAQQLVAEAAAGPVHVDNLYALARRAWPWRELSRAAFDATVDLLAEGIATAPGRTTALLHRDGVRGRVRGRRAARLAAATGAGAIPDTAQYAVVAEPDGAVVGQLDEDFAIESLAGDVFLLGSTSWRVRRVEQGVVRVEDARGAPPSVPFWNGEAPGRSAELSREVSALRGAVAARLDDPGGAARWLEAECALPPAGALQAVEYVAATRAALGLVPTQDALVAERFFDEAGGMQVVLHAPLGARTNRALGLALRKRFCRTFDFELQAAATDDGVLLSLGPQHSFPLESIFALVTGRTVDEVLEQAVLQAPMFGVRWRWCATRALAIPRVWKGRRIPPQIARMRAEDLLAAVFPRQAACQDNAPGGPIEIPDHPLVREALSDCLREGMDAAGLRALLGRIAAGEVALHTVDTAEPSPFAHELLGARPWAFLDDAPLEERRARAVATRRTLPAADAAGAGALDPAAIAEVEAQVAPAPRDAEEVHDLLLDVVLLPDAEARPLRGGLDVLADEGRAARLEAGGAAWWVAAERVGTALRAVRVFEAARDAAPAGDPSPLPLPAERGEGDAGGARGAGRAEGDVRGARTRLAPPLAPLPAERVPEDAGAALAAALRGWAPRTGPFTAAGLAARLALPEGAIAAALARLEAEGRVLRGRFLPGAPEAWCERGVLARVHRLTVGRLRQEIEPVSAATFLRFLARWQHLAPGTRLHGPRGLAEVVGQLQGFHAPAAAWERELLPARVAGYAPGDLDALCLSGEVAFGRLAVDGAEDEPPRRRSAPTRAAPVTLLLREDLPWLLDAVAGPPPALGPEARALVEVLAVRGASFAPELAAATGASAAEVEARLWELVSAGCVTCDAFAGLRGLVEPPPSRPSRAGFAGGRWSLLRAAPGGRAGDGEGEAALERLAQLYLRRWGVVLPGLLDRECAPPPWRDLVRVYRTLEARGAIRGGRFVAGFSGEQFALPGAVEALRATRRLEAQGADALEVAAADPLNVAGVLLPGPRVPATSRARAVLLGPAERRAVP